MSGPARFLAGLSQALSTMALYGDEHPATARVMDVALERLAELQSTRPELQFTFLPGEVLFNSEAVKELENWEWGNRLIKAGIERIEFTESARQEEFVRFLENLAIRLGIRSGSSTDLWQMGRSPIRFGQIAVEGQHLEQPQEAQLSVATLTYSLQEEQETIDWLHHEIQAGAKLPIVEADAVVRSLSIAMHAEQAMVLPLLQLKEFDQYTTTHSMNVSVLAMALSEFLELGGASVRTIGIAGLLHDLGKVCIPRDILVKPGKLTDAEREVVREHPVVGARMLLACPDPMEIAAIVAYEHHVMIDGGGYPTLSDDRGAQYASRMVHICDVYDALRTNRPYRVAWDSERALAYIESRAGVEFDPALARSFIAMMRKWERRIALVPA
jgi:putative nucleotidyltransferase with HDIG domain